MKCRIVLADDHKLFRHGIKELLAKNPVFEIIGEAQDGREAIKLCNELRPDIILMDIGMKNLNGIDATRQILLNNPEIKVIGLSMHKSKQYVTGMLKAGAFGYLMKDIDSEELIKAIKTVALNQKYICSKVSALIVDEFVKAYNYDELGLSDREREVLQLIAEGNSSKEIGDLLFLSPKTIDVHRKNIMDKLNLRSIPDLTKYAIRSGLTTLND